MRTSVPSLLPSIVPSVGTWVRNVKNISTSTSAICPRKNTGLLPVNRQKKVGFQEINSLCISVFDATGKLQPGILSGNMVSLGFFDQCLDVSKYTYAGQINGKYCLGSVSLGIEMDVDDVSPFSKKTQPSKLEPFQLDPLESHQSLDVSWGVCVPHSCQADDLVPIFQNLITGVVDASNVTVHFDQNLCQTYADVHPKLSAGAIVTMYAVDLKTSPKL